MLLRIFLADLYNNTNIFLGRIEYELKSILGVFHLADYKSGHVSFDLERYLFNMYVTKAVLDMGRGT